jgi:hypothetical protein
MIIRNEGTVVVFSPEDEVEKLWIADHVESEDWQWFGQSLTVDHRYADDLEEYIREAGLVIKHT